MLNTGEGPVLLSSTSPQLDIHALLRSNSSVAFNGSGTAACESLVGGFVQKIVTANGPVGTKVTDHQKNREIHTPAPCVQHSRLSAPETDSLLFEAEILGVYPPPAFMAPFAALGQLAEGAHAAFSKAMSILQGGSAASLSSVQQTAGTEHTFSLTTRHVTPPLESLREPTLKRLSRQDEQEVVALLQSADRSFRVLAAHSQPKGSHVTVLAPHSAAAVIHLLRAVCALMRQVRSWFPSNVFTTEGASEPNRGLNPIDSVFASPTQMGPFPASGAAFIASDCLQPLAAQLFNAHCPFIFRFLFTSLSEIDSNGRHAPPTTPLATILQQYLSAIEWYAEGVDLQYVNVEIEVAFSVPEFTRSFVSTAGTVLAATMRVPDPGPACAEVGGSVLSRTQYAGCFASYERVFCLGVMQLLPRCCDDHNQRFVLPPEYGLSVESNSRSGRVADGDSHLRDGKGVANPSSLIHAFERRSTRAAALEGLSVVPFRSILRIPAWGTWKREVESSSSSNADPVELNDALCGNAPVCLQCAGYAPSDERLAHLQQQFCDQRQLPYLPASALVSGSYAHHGGELFGPSAPVQLHDALWHLILSFPSLRRLLLIVPHADAVVNHLGFGSADAEDESAANLEGGQCASTDWDMWSLPESQDDDSSADTPTIGGTAVQKSPPSGASHQRLLLRDATLCLQLFSPTQGSASVGRGSEHRDKHCPPLRKYPSYSPLFYRPLLHTLLGNRNIAQALVSADPTFAQMVTAGLLLVTHLSTTSAKLFQSVGTAGGDPSQRSGQGEKTRPPYQPDYAVKVQLTTAAGLVRAPSASVLSPVPSREAFGAPSDHDPTGGLSLAGALRGTSGRRGVPGPATGVRFAGDSRQSSAADFAPAPTTGLSGAASLAAGRRSPIRPTAPSTLPQHKSQGLLGRLGALIRMPRRLMGGAGNRPTTAAVPLSRRSSATACSDTATVADDEDSESDVAMYQGLSPQAMARVMDSGITAIIEVPFLSAPLMIPRWSASDEEAARETMTGISNQKLRAFCQCLRQTIRKSPIIYRPNTALFDFSHPVDTMRIGILDGLSPIPMNSAAPAGPRDRRGSYRSSHAASESASSDEEEGGTFSSCQSTTSTERSSCESDAQNSFYSFDSETGKTAEVSAGPHHSEKIHTNRLTLERMTRAHEWFLWHFAFPTSHDLATILDGLWCVLEAPNALLPFCPEVSAEGGVMTLAFENCSTVVDMFLASVLKSIIVEHVSTDDHGPCGGDRRTIHFHPDASITNDYSRTLASARHCLHTAMPTMTSQPPLSSSNGSPYSPQLRTDPLPSIVKTLYGLDVTTVKAARASPGASLNTHPPEAQSGTKTREVVHAAASYVASWLPSWHRAGGAVPRAAMDDHHGLLREIDHTSTSGTLLGGHRTLLVQSPVDPTSALKSTSRAHGRSNTARALSSVIDQEKLVLTLQRIRALLHANVHWASALDGDFAFTSMPVLAASSTALLVQQRYRKQTHQRSLQEPRQQHGHHRLANNHHSKTSGDDAASRGALVNSTDPWPSIQAQLLNLAEQLLLSGTLSNAVVSGLTAGACHWHHVLASRIRDQICREATESFFRITTLVAPLRHVGKDAFHRRHYPVLSQIIAGTDTSAQLLTAMLHDHRGARILLEQIHSNVPAQSFATSADHDDGTLDSRAAAIDEILSCFVMIQPLDLSKSGPYGGSGTAEQIAADLSNPRFLRQHPSIQWDLFRSRRQSVTALLAVTRGRLIALLQQLLVREVPVLAADVLLATNRLNLSVLREQLSSLYPQLIAKHLPPERSPLLRTSAQRCSVGVAERALVLTPQLIFNSLWFSGDESGMDDFKLSLGSLFQNPSISLLARSIGHDTHSQRAGRRREGSDQTPMASTKSVDPKDTSTSKDASFDIVAQEIGIRLAFIAAKLTTGGPYTLWPTDDYLFPTPLANLSRYVSFVLSNYEEIMTKGMDRCMLRMSSAERRRVDQARKVGGRKDSSSSSEGRISTSDTSSSGDDSGLDLVDVLVTPGLPPAVSSAMKRDRIRHSSRKGGDAFVQSGKHAHEGTSDDPFLEFEYSLREAAKDTAGTLEDVIGSLERRTASQVYVLDSLSEDSPEHLFLQETMLSDLVVLKRIYSRVLDAAVQMAWPVANRETSGTAGPIESIQLSLPRMRRLVTVVLTPLISKIVRMGRLCAFASVVVSTPSSAVLLHHGIDLEDDSWAKVCDGREDDVALLQSQLSFLCSQRSFHDVVTEAAIGRSFRALWMLLCWANIPDEIEQQRKMARSGQASRGGNTPSELHRGSHWRDRATLVHFQSSLRELACTAPSLVQFTSHEYAAAISDATLLYNLVFDVPSHKTLFGALKRKKELVFSEMDFRRSLANRFLKLVPMAKVGGKHIHLVSQLANGEPRGQKLVFGRMNIDTALGRDASGPELLLMTSVAELEVLRARSGVAVVSYPLMQLADIQLRNFEASEGLLCLVRAVAVQCIDTFIATALAPSNGSGAGESKLAVVATTLHELLFFACADVSMIAAAAMEAALLIAHHFTMAASHPSLVSALLSGLHALEQGDFGEQGGGIQDGASSLARQNPLRQLYHRATAQINSASGKSVRRLRNILRGRSGFGVRLLRTALQKLPTAQAGGRIADGSLRLDDFSAFVSEWLGMAMNASPSHLFDALAGYIVSSQSDGVMSFNEAPANAGTTLAMQSAVACVAAASRHGCWPRGIMSLATPLVNRNLGFILMRRNEGRALYTAQTKNNDPFNDDPAMNESALRSESARRHFTYHLRRVTEALVASSNQASNPSTTLTTEFISLMYANTASLLASADSVTPFSSEQANTSDPCEADIAILQALVDCPMRLFHPGALRVAVECWRWIVTARPSVAPALLSTIVSAVRLTFVRRRGLFDGAHPQVARYVETEEYGALCQSLDMATTNDGTPTPHALVISFVAEYFVASGVVLSENKNVLIELADLLSICVSYLDAISLKAQSFTESVQLFLLLLHIVHNLHHATRTAGPPVPLPTLAQLRRQLYRAMVRWFSQLIPAFHNADDGTDASQSAHVLIAIHEALQEEIDSLGSNPMGFHDFGPVSFATTDIQLYAAQRSGTCERDPREFAALTRIFPFTTRTTASVPADGIRGFDSPFSPISSSDGIGGAEVLPDSPAALLADTQRTTQHIHDTLLLLQALFAHDHERLATWCYATQARVDSPLGAHPLGDISRFFRSKSKNDWNVLIRAATEEHPVLVPCLAKRFSWVASAVDACRMMVSSKPVLFQHIPEAVELYLTPQTLAAGATHLQQWAPGSIIESLRLFSEYFQSFPLVISYATRSMMGADAERLIFYLPQLLQCLGVDKTGMIEAFLKQQALSNVDFGHQLLWSLRTETVLLAPETSPTDRTAKRTEKGKSTVSDPQILVKKCEHLSSAIVESFSGDQLSFFTNEFDYIASIIAVSGSLKSVEKAKRKQQLRDLLSSSIGKYHVPCKEHFLYLPTNPNMQMVSIIPETAGAMQSAAKCPILVQFRCVPREIGSITRGSPLEKEEEDDARRAVSDARVHRHQGGVGRPPRHQPAIVRGCIFKFGDDCRQDQIAIQLIHLFKRIFEAANLPFFLFPYRVVTTAPNCGVIECVPNAMSRDQIGKLVESNLGEYFIQKYGHPQSERFRAARAAFVSSMASYSVVSFILNIKDRHNGNIMLDEAGHLIHIDFGFLFDFSPGGDMNFESSPFKLTAEMLQLMGDDSTSPATRRGAGGPGRGAADKKGSNLSSASAATSAAPLLVTEPLQALVCPESYDRFVEYTVRCFLAVRQFSREICILVELMLSSRLPCFKPFKTIADLSKRLATEMSEAAAADFMRERIIESRDNMRTNLYDRYQNMAEGIEM